MPIYEYQCSNCGHTLDELQTMSEPPLVKCPKCGKDTLKRLIGTGGGLIFKGSGFYLTDYKNSKSADKPKDTSKPGKKEQAKTESKSSKAAQTKADTGSTENKSTGSKQGTQSPTKTNGGKN